ncbi:MAG TPA: DUF2905 domain-containing protein [Tepidisphaeraceae bacterium]|nr:DUF2905 domain-containing protein [Tepidisphaeraceae bacterium]
MVDIRKLLIGLGVLLVAVGLVVWGLGRAGFRGLPGDIRYQGEHVRVYFPIVTCIFVSLLATALLWLWQWMSRK